MSNSLLTIDMITRFATRLWKNQNPFLRNIDTQYDPQFAVEGAKIGSSVRIRLPNEYTTRDGAAASVQDTQEQKVTLNLSTQSGVDVAFTTAERTLSLDDYQERVLMPKIAFLTARVANGVISDSEGGVSNYVSAVDGSGNVIAPTQTTILNARAQLVMNSIPDEDMMRLVATPPTMAKITSALTGLLNPAPQISKQYRKGRMYDGLGFLWYEDPTVINHTTGSFSAGGTVNGAGQTGSAITVNAVTGTLKKGDIVTFAGVNAINRLTRVSTGALKQFVVTADVANGGVTVNIYPAMTPAVGGVGVQYQTCTASPANGAAMALINKANEVYRKNIAYIPDLCTMATADLYLPSAGIIEGFRDVFDGISMRSIVAYAVGTDQTVDRLDIIWGDLFVRPEWGVVVADSVP